MCLYTGWKASRAFHCLEIGHFLIRKYCDYCHIFATYWLQHYNPTIRRSYDNEFEKSSVEKLSILSFFFSLKASPMRAGVCLALRWAVYETLYGSKIGSLSNGRSSTQNFAKTWVEC